MKARGTEKAGAFKELQATLSDQSKTSKWDSRKFLGIKYFPSQGVCILSKRTWGSIKFVVKSLHNQIHILQRCPHNSGKNRFRWINGGSSV